MFSKPKYDVKNIARKVRENINVIIEKLNNVLLQKLILEYLFLC